MNWQDALAPADKIRTHFDSPFTQKSRFEHCFEHERDAIRSTAGLEALSLCLYEASALQNRQNRRKS